MALLFVDSFDHLSTAQILRKWTSGGGSIVAGRTNNGLAANANTFPTKTFNAEYAKLTMGLAYRTPGYGNNLTRFQNAINSIQVDLAHVGDGRLKLTFSMSGGSGASAPSTWVMSLNTWYYFEVSAEITAASPPHIIASARVNGAEILSHDYTHATSPTTPKFAGVTMNGPGGAVTTIDDLYVTDGEFLGDVKIGVLYPNAAGDIDDWTPTPAGNNWQQVEEHPADDDTSYVAAASTGLKDLYHMDDIDPAFSGDIKGVQALWCVKKSDEGAGAVKGLWKSGATEITQASGHNYLAPGGYYPSATDYTYNIQTERESLFTAVDWTVAEINALQMGITRTL